MVGYLKLLGLVKKTHFFKHIQRGIHSLKIGNFKDQGAIKKQTILAVPRVSLKPRETGSLFEPSSGFCSEVKPDLLLG